LPLAGALKFLYRMPQIPCSQDLTTYSDLSGF
jgi:hypothetical protein